MAIHRWRAVIDFYADEDLQAPHIAVDQRLAFVHDVIREAFTNWFPCGVVEGYPDVYDQDEKRAKIETPLG